MKQYHVFLVLAVLMSMVGTKAFAYDVEAENEDGITIYYNYINNTELEVTYRYRDGIYSTYTGNIVIPESVTILNRTRNVTSIGKEAFYNCEKLSSITIPASVTSIGDDAFRECRGLKKVIVKDLAAWCSISFGDNPLYYAQHLYTDENTEITDLVIPEGVTSIGDRAFYICRGLSSVTIPEGVTSIGSSAFSGCSSLSSVTIPEGVTSIGSYAFYSCSGLKKVIVKDLAAWCNISFGYGSNPLRYAHHLYTDENTEITDLVIPEGVTSIGSDAFSGCSGLSSVTIPDGVTTIGNSAFSDCSGLGSVTIPASVTSIGDYAFYRCENLATIVSFIEEPSSASFYDRSFSSITLNNATLYVPQGTTEKYKAAKGWKNFVWIEEGVPAGIKLPTNENVESAGVLRYAPDGRRLAEPKRGLNIMKMPDGKTKKVIVR